MGAFAVVEFCFILAVAMLGVMGLLIARRWLAERNSERRKAEDRLLSKAYLRRVAGSKEDVAADIAQPEKRLKVILRLIELLRGTERERLIEIARTDGLLVAPLRKIHSISAAHRIESIRVLSACQGADCISALTERMENDSNDIVRMEAALALADMGCLPPPRKAAAMLGGYGRSITLLHKAVFRSLATLHTGEMRDMLGDRMPHPFRALIIETLGWSHNHEVFATLRRASFFGDPDIRSAAARAMTELGHPAAELVITKMLADEDTAVRIQAIDCCAALNLKRTVPVLEALLSDEALWVRLRAQQAIEKLAPERLALREPGERKAGQVELQAGA